MNNIFPIIEVHKRFDLKGSVHKRISTEKERRDPKVALKDLDFINMNYKIKLGKEKRKIFLKQIRSDAKFLSENEILDYSLLLGIHNRTKHSNRKTSIYDEQQFDLSQIEDF